MMYYFNPYSPKSIIYWNINTFWEDFVLMVNAALMCRHLLWYACLNSTRWSLRANDECVTSPHITYFKEETPLHGAKCSFPEFVFVAITIISSILFPHFYYFVVTRCPSKTNENYYFNDQNNIVLVALLKLFEHILYGIGKYAAKFS